LSGASLWDADLREVRDVDVLEFETPGLIPTPLLDNIYRNMLLSIEGGLDERGLNCEQLAVGTNWEGAFRHSDLACGKPIREPR
jgi:hypothetical protein